MSKKFEFYNGEKIYMTAKATLVSPEYIAEKYPAVNVFKHVVETDSHGEVMFALENFSAMRDRYNIDDTLSDDEALTAIQNIINTPKEVVEVVSDETRIADALEDMVVLQELNSMEV